MAGARGLYSRNRLSAARGRGRTGFSRKADARGLYYRILHVSARAGRKAKVSAGVARDGCTTRIQRIHPRGAGLRTVPGTGRSGPTWWSLQNRGSPRPRSRAKRGGRAPEAPKGGRRVPRRGGMIRPRDAKPAREKQLFPRKLSRGTRPARPAGGGTNAFCFPSLVAPAPPRHRNTLHKTQNSAVLHVNFPDSFARYKDYFVPDPRGCCSIVFRKTIRARYPK